MLKMAKIGKKRLVVILVFVIMAELNYGLYRAEPNFGLYQAKLNFCLYQSRAKFWFVPEPS